MNPARSARDENPEVGRTARLAVIDGMEFEGGTKSDLRAQFSNASDLKA
ncbi:MAG: hypothetical protein AAF771_07115 [Pseudomonadota bacterium]